MNFWLLLEILGPGRNNRLGLRRGHPSLLLGPLHSFVLSMEPKWAFEFAILSQNFGILEAASCLNCLYSLQQACSNL